jgi:hypothetical protein
MKYLLLILISLNALAECENSYQVKTEKDKQVVFCTKEDLQISQSCSENYASCSLVKDLKSKTVSSKVLSSSIKGNPGSRICNSLGWKVHMATLFDESQVCTCLHPGGEYITCSSLSEFYQQKSKAKK